MEKYVLGFGILAVAVWFLRSLMRPRPLTGQEKDFMSFVHDQAKQIRISREEIQDFVSVNFDRLVVEHAVNGPLILNDVPRLIREIVVTYQRA